MRSRISVIGLGTGAVRQQNQQELSRAEDMEPEQVTGDRATALNKAYGSKEPGRAGEMKEVVVTAQSRVCVVSRRGAKKAKTTHYYAGKRKTKCPNLMVLVPGAECQPCIGACGMQGALQCTVESAHTNTHA